MRHRRLALALAFAAGLPLGARATDAPHDLSNLDQSSAGINCKSCHSPHNAQGAALTSVAGNSNLCDSCHSLSTRYGFPWNTSEQAIPDASGTSHRWDANATNLGATAPTSSAGGGIAQMALRLPSGKLECSTCHDQHNGANNFKGNARTSVALATTMTRLAGTGTGTLVLTATPSGAAAAGYRIRIDPALATRFQISHDRGTSWFGYNSTATPNWGPTTNATYAAGKPFTSGTAVTLDDGITTVTFTNTFAVTDVFQDFYVSYPFLRMDNAANQMCVGCHQDRNQSHTRVSAGDSSFLPNGTRIFHHPVGDSLNTNAGGYDRGNSTTLSVLDANGAVQATANDGIKSNDILMGANNTVLCLSCHRPHNADSNSLTELP